MKRTIVAAGLVFALWAVFVQPASAGNSLGLAWPHDGSSQVSVTLVDIHDGSQWNGVVGDVGSAWDVPTGGSLDTLDIGYAGSSTWGSDTNGKDVCSLDWNVNKAPGGGTNEIIFCNADLNQNGWLGVANIWRNPDTGEIVVVQAIMNDFYFDGYYNFDDQQTSDARLHVACQEVGHGFGLDHQKSPKNPSCMNDNWGLASGGSWNEPNDHDFATLQDIYLSGGGGGDTGSGGNKPCNPKSPKCAQSADGHQQRGNRNLVKTTIITPIPG